MNTISLVLKDFQDVKEFLAVVENYPTMIYAKDVSGMEVNAKGVLSLMLLNRSKPIELYSKSNDDLSDLREKLKHFVV